MLNSLRRETVKFGRDVVHEIVAGIAVWKGCSGRFKFGCLYLALLFVLFGVTETICAALGERPRWIDNPAVVIVVAIYAAIYIGKKRRWF